MLDFGLARRHSPDHLKDLSSLAPSVPGTELVAGTLPHVWRPNCCVATPRRAQRYLGARLAAYEMATGTRPFTGSTGFELSGAILHQPPAPLPADVPLSLKQIILRCLEKEPRQRYQQAGDVRAALESMKNRIESLSFHRAPLPWAAIALVAPRLSALPYVWRNSSPASSSCCSYCGVASECDRRDEFRERCRDARHRVALEGRAADARDRTRSDERPAYRQRAAPRGSGEKDGRDAHITTCSAVPSSPTWRGNRGRARS